MMAANQNKRRCQQEQISPRSLLFEHTAPREPAVGVGSKGLVHPLLIQHLQWLSTLFLLAPIFLSQVPATVHGPQTVLYLFDSQSQSAAEANKPNQTGRIAGNSNTFSSFKEQCKGWSLGTSSLSADGWGQGFCTSTCHLVVRHKEEGAKALDTELRTNSRQL